MPYDASKLDSSAIMRVRLEIGDTDSKEYLKDSEITYFLGKYSDHELRASIACVEAILAKVADDVDASTAGVSTSRSQLTNQFRDLLKDLKAKLASEGIVGLPISTGQSISDGISRLGDTDYLGPSFTIGEHDYDC